MSSYPYPAAEHFPGRCGASRISARVQHAAGAAPDPAACGQQRRSEMRRYSRSSMTARGLSLALLIVNSAYLAAFAHADHLLRWPTCCCTWGWAWRWPWRRCVCCAAVSARVRRVPVAARLPRGVPRGARQHAAAPLGPVAAHRAGGGRGGADRAAQAGIRKQLGVSRCALLVAAARFDGAVPQGTARTRTTAS